MCIHSFRGETRTWRYRCTKELAQKSSNGALVSDISETSNLGIPKRDDALIYIYILILVGG